MENDEKFWWRLPLYFIAGSDRETLVLKSADKEGSPLFTDEDLAQRMCPQENQSRPVVLRSFKDVKRWLAMLDKRGVTHVCFDPRTEYATFTPISEVRESLPD